jgi:hypothetical protein
MTLSVGTGDARNSGAIRSRSESHASSKSDTHPTWSAQTQLRESTTANAREEGREQLVNEICKTGLDNLQNFVDFSLASSPK